MTKFSWKVVPPFPRCLLFCSLTNLHRWFYLFIFNRRKPGRHFFQVPLSVRSWGGRKGILRGIASLRPSGAHTGENMLKSMGSVQSHPHPAQTLSCKERDMELGVVSSPFYNLTVCGVLSRSNAQCQSCNNRMQKRFELKGSGLLCLWSRGLEQTGKSSRSFL